MKAYIHASEILTGEGIRKKSGRRVREEDLGRIVDGAIVYSDKKIEWVGPTSELPKKFSKIGKINLHLKHAIVPGFVDCHTHLVFAGDRADEFADRCAGVTYQEIAARGGGILKTVRATREASADELEKLAHERLSDSWSFGVRTIEIKSGYGLSPESETKVLDVVSRLKKKRPEMTIIPTFLGAHAVPKEKSKAEYLETLKKMLPQVSKKAHSCDIFVDEGYFTKEDALDLLIHAKKVGMKTRIHADELGNTESAALAAEMGSLSADHLLKISDHGIQALAQSDTVAVILPGTAFYLKAQHAPARKLLDAGARVALSTDFNPGTCMTLSLPTIMNIAALYLGMSRAEIFAAVTLNAAKALDLDSRKGTLEKGMDADFLVLPFPKFEEVYYRFAPNGFFGATGIGKKLRGKKASKRRRP